MDGVRSGQGDAMSTAVVVGTPVDGDGRAGTLDDGRALLVEHAGIAYLVYDGHRARVDLSDRAVTGALALDGVEPRPVSAGLLAAIPEVPPITAPRIDGAGTRATHGLSDVEVGSVVAVPARRNHRLLRGVAVRAAADRRGHR